MSECEKCLELHKLIAAEERISDLERELDSLKPGTIKTMKMCECGRHYHLPSDKCCDKCMIAELEQQLAEQKKEIDGCIEFLDEGEFPLPVGVCTELERKLLECVTNSGDIVDGLQAQLAEHEKFSEGVFLIMSSTGKPPTCDAHPDNDNFDCGYETLHSVLMGRLKRIKPIHLPEAKPEGEVKSE